MRRKVLILLLGLGTLAGFGSGFAHLKYRLNHCDHACDQVDRDRPAM